MLAASAAGELLLARPADLVVESKSSATDAVTAMDRASEDLLVRMLLADGATDAVLGEEGGERAGSSGVRWVLDPLDGTVNYLYGLPEWAVSVAAQRQGRTVAGVVAAPLLQRRWWAVAGGGAWTALGDDEPRRLQVGGERRLGHALTGTGFGYAADRRGRQGELLARVIAELRDVRRIGSAAIDLCYVAGGEFDAYFEQGLHEWDSAAAALIVAEAGGAVEVLADWEPDGSALTAAANPDLLRELRALLVAAQSSRRSSLG
ncbi:MAG: inositol monophosphatase [Actinobacteria bacterium]|nr:MAG: inositol monophosphatase [Actinomycetota bacterium]